MIAKLRTFLASWWFTAALLLALCAAYLSFTFGEAPYARWVRFLFHSPLGLGLYAGLIVNLLAASLLVAGSALGKRPLAPETIRAMDAWTSAATTDPRALQKAEAWMKSKGFPADAEGNAVRGVQGAFSFLPGAAFRAGLVVLLASVLVSASLRRSEVVTLHAGEKASAFGRSFTLERLSAALPADYLQVGDEDAFLLEKASATVTSSGASYEVTPGLPVRLGGIFVRLVHLGYAQSFAGSLGGAAFARDIDLDVLPPGRTEIVPLASGAFFTVSLEPDRTITKGLLKGKQYNLASPLYRIVVQRGREAGNAAALTLRAGERGSAQGAVVSLGRDGLYARLQAVRDPALPAIYLGLLLTFAGAALMISRFFWFRKELVALYEGTTLFVGCKEEYFKKWGIRRFHLWKGELLALLDAETKP